jgi:transposase
MRKLVFYNYKEIPALFRVSIQTVRNWAWRGDFKPCGYRRLKGWNKKEAVVTEEQVKLLILKKLIAPTLPFH